MARQSAGPLRLGITRACMDSATAGCSTDKGPVCLSTTELPCKAGCDACPALLLETPEDVTGADGQQFKTC